MIAGPHLRVARRARSDPRRACRLIVAGAAVATVGLVAGCTASSGGSTSSPAVAQTLPASGSSTSGSGSAPASGSGSTAPTSIHPTTYPKLPSSTGAAPTPQRTKTPVAITRTATFGGNVTGSITAVRSITAKATLPGEVAGPAFAISIRLTNGSARTINLANSVVNVGYGAAQTPGSPMSSSPSKPFVGSLAAGKHASAVYVFRVSQASGRILLTIQVSYSPAAPVVVFSGYQR